jgi:glycosyltransferase involved in cell wall biosynthesis
MADPRVLLFTKGLDLGGLERVVVDLAVTMHKQGVPVEVAVVNDDRDALAGVLTDNAIPLHLLGGTDTIGIEAARRFAQLVHRGPFDVVHAHGPLPTVVARLLSGRTPVVSTSHTIWTAVHPATRALWSMTATRDAATVAVSAAVADSLPTHTKNPVVIPHGVDPVAIKDASAAAERARARRFPVTAVTVASHRPAKDYPTLLLALELAVGMGADLGLIAVGDGPHLGSNKKLAHELGLSDRIEFRPATKEILDVIAGADFVVVSSDFEGQPLVVVEAIALGIPVVATAVGRVPELVNDSMGRVVPTRDPIALAEAIVEVTSDPDLRHRMRMATLKAPAWSLERVVTAHLAVYRS